MNLAVHSEGVSVRFHFACALNKFWQVSAFKYWLLAQVEMVWLFKKWT